MWKELLFVFKGVGLQHAAFEEALLMLQASHGMHRDAVEALHTPGVLVADIYERDREIIEQRILAESPLTLQDLGERFEVSRERIRQLEARLVKQLREYLKENLVDFEYYAPSGN